MSIEMLWGSRAEHVVRESFERAKWSSERDRQLDAERRRDILGDDWKDLLWSKVCDIYKSEKIRASIHGLLSIEHNVLKRIATELSSCYKWGATRELVNDPRQQEIARSLWAEVDMDSTLEVADLLLTVLRDLLIVPWVDDGKMRLELLTPDRVSIIQHPRIPTEAVGFWWERTSSQTVGQSEIQKILADDSTWRIYSSGGKLLEERFHGLGRLPATVLHADKRIDSFWEPKPFQDVVDATLMVGVLMVMLARLQYLQSELQVTYAGDRDDLERGASVGGDTIWAAPGQFGMLNLQADPQHYVSHIKARIGWIAQCYGLAADVYDLSSSPGSGLQIRFKRLPLMEARTKRIKTWRRAEQDLYLLMAMVSRDHPTLKLDPGAKFRVNFNEEPFLEDPLTESRVLDEQVKAGRLSPVDVLMRDDPDLTREEAVAKAKRIAEERGEWVRVNRELNVSNDSQSGPGQSPEDNGAAGGKKRAMLAAVRAVLAGGKSQ